MPRAYPHLPTLALVFQSELPSRLATTILSWALVWAKEIHCRLGSENKKSTA